MSSRTFRAFRIFVLSCFFSCFSVDQPLDLQPGSSKVQQQTQFETRCFDIIEDLDIVFRRHLASDLDLDHYVFHNEIGSAGVNLMPLVDDGHLDLTLKLQPSRLQL